MRISCLCLLFIGLVFPKNIPINDVKQCFETLTGGSQRIWIESNEIPVVLNVNYPTYTFNKGNTVEIKEKSGASRTYRFSLKQERNRIIIEINGNNYYVTDLSNTPKSNSRFNCLRFSILNLNVSRNMTHIFLYSPRI